MITDVSMHADFVRLAAAHHLPVVCQKPMAADLETAQAMVAACREAGVWFAVHEIGGQPLLEELEQFILADIGSHILDTARFLFGEARHFYCRTQRLNPGIRGEDVAAVMLDMEGGATVTCEMSYASGVEHDRFPETYVLAECERGAVTLTPDYWVRVTTAEGTIARRYPPPHYPWANAAYDLVQASIAPCNAHLLASLRSGVPAETSGEDNFRTMGLVFACYESARTGQAVSLET